MCKQETEHSIKRDQCCQEDPAFDPAALGRVLGEIINVECICPGVFYVAARSNSQLPNLGVEYYIVSKDSPAISATAKTYGKDIPGHPELLSYLYEDKHSGRFIIEYEAYRYMTNHHIPLPEGETLRETATYGAELNPEYFGAYPVPLVTPWGYTLRNKVIDNGVYWLDTEEYGWVLAVHFPLTTELTEVTKRKGRYTAYDQTNDKQQISCLLF